MLGTAAPEPVREMLVYARETQHEKIIRGLAIGVAFIYYGRQEEANETIKLLLAEDYPLDAWLKALKGCPLEISSRR